jgi:hypothetical protein
MMTKQQARIMQQPIQIKFIQWDDARSKGNEIVLDFSKIDPDDADNVVDLYNGLGAEEKQLVLYALVTRKNLVDNELGHKALIIK